MIDVKELHIGTHIMHKGKSSRIEVIYGELVGINVGNDKKFGKSVIAIPAERINPIHITPELLEELGFVYNSTQERWRKEQTNEFPFVCIDIMHDGLCRVDVADTHYVYGNILCRYLHELEAFVYLTTKQELIKD